MPEQAADRRASIEVRAGFGIVGDRYAGKPAHRDAAVTVMAVEPLDALAAELGVPPFDPCLTRRNVVLRGADVESLRGQTFALDCGEGVVRAPRRTVRRIPARGWTSSSRPARTAACGDEAASAAPPTPAECSGSVPP